MNDLPRVAGIAPSLHGADASLPFVPPAIVRGLAMAMLVIVAMLVAFSDWFSMNDADVGRMVLLGAVVLLSLAMYTFGYFGHARAASAAAVTVIWGTVTWYLYFTGMGLHSAVTFLYLDLILFSALLFGTAFAVAQSVLTLLALAGFYFAEKSSLIGGVDAYIAKTNNFNFLLGVIGACITAMILAALFRRTVDVAAKRTLAEIEAQRRTLGELHDANVELKTMHDALSALNETLEQSVAERTIELSMQIQELESFGYAAAHDLRAPLRAINGFSATLRDVHGGDFSPEATHLMQRIGAAAQRADLLLAGLLGMVRLSRHMLAREEVDLSALGERIAAQLAPPGSAAQIAIEPGMRAFCDPVLAANLLGKLFDNAVKFSREALAPEIAFGVTGTSGAQVFHVRDNGAGFDPRYADKLFRTFYRLHSEKEFEGIGIGLASARRIVERHGGGIWAESASGAGAVFYFTLPPRSRA